MKYLATLKTAFSLLSNEMNTANGVTFYRRINDEKADKLENELRQIRSELANELEPLQNELDNLQARCSARKISAHDILETLYLYDRKLGISAKAKEGIQVSVDFNAQDFPSAYKYTPESTHFSAVYKSGSWRVLCVRRDITRRRSQQIDATLTAAAKEALVAKYELGRI